MAGIMFALLRFSSELSDRAYVPGARCIGLFLL